MFIITGKADLAWLAELVAPEPVKMSAARLIIGKASHKQERHLMACFSLLMDERQSNALPSLDEVNLRVRNYSILNKHSDRDIQMIWRRWLKLWKVRTGWKSDVADQSRLRTVLDECQKRHQLSDYDMTVKTAIAYVQADPAMKHFTEIQVRNAFNRWRDNKRLARTMAILASTAHSQPSSGSTTEKLGHRKFVEQNPQHPWSVNVKNFERELQEDYKAGEISAAEYNACSLLRSGLTN